VLRALRACMSALSAAIVRTFTRMLALPDFSCEALEVSGGGLREVVGALMGS